MRRRPSTSTSRRTPHGDPGHLNIYERDEATEVTGFGQHKRCIVMRDVESGVVEVRCDDTPADLPWPTMTQAKAVALGERRVHDHGQLRFSHKDEWSPDWPHVTYYFDVVTAPRERETQPTMLDRLLDRVEAGQRELSIDTEGYTRSQVDRVITTAQGRGLSAAYDGRFVLVRDLRGARTPSVRPSRAPRASRATALPREPAHRRQQRLDTGANTFRLVSPEPGVRPERKPAREPISDQQMGFDIDTRPRYRR
jgi:hypothetical protein